jgi:ubiquinone biosynthesis protein
VPEELNLIGKVCGNLGAVARILDPRMQPTRTIRRHISGMVLRQARQSLTPANLLSGALELRRLTQKLPERINRLMDMLADNQLRVKLDVFDERRMMAAFQKVANRITVGLLLAAMILAAALLMRYESPYTFLGYPALPMVLLTGAGIGAIAFILTALLRDDRQPPTPPSRDE